MTTLTWDFRHGHGQKIFDHDHGQILGKYTYVTLELNENSQKYTYNTLELNGLFQKYTNVTLELN